MFTVYDANTNEELPGRPSRDLIQESNDALPTGAVAAYQAPNGSWIYVREDEIDFMWRSGLAVLTVYVMP